MPWDLRIIHIDVKQGDSTLIVARNVPAVGAPVLRSCLIDGGRGDQSGEVDSVIAAELAGAGLDVMIVTHYDNDHLNGCRELLRTNPGNRYDTTYLYDQGIPGEIRAPRCLEPQADDNYSRYRTAARSSPRRIRVTHRVASEPTNCAEYRAPSWLLGKEVLWAVPQRFTQVNGSYVYDPSGTHTRAWNAATATFNYAPAPAGSDWNALGDPVDVNGNALIPAGAPTIRCIAANQYVQGSAGYRVQGGLHADPKNEKSLAFLVEFNQFRYYIGGDIESAQEDMFVASIVNPDVIQNRVLAMKASHHGSDKSSSQAFLNRLRPSAAFISCGFNNSYDLPEQAVLTRLEAVAQLVRYYLTADRNDQDYLGRNGSAGPPAVAPALNPPYTAKAVVAGAWGAPHDPAPNAMHGHIRLTVSSPQSQNARSGHLPAGQSRFTVSCVTAVINALNNPANFDHL